MTLRLRITRITGGAWGRFGPVGAEWGWQGSRGRGAGRGAGQGSAAQAWPILVARPSLRVM